MTRLCVFLLLSAVAPVEGREPGEAAVQSTEGNKQEEAATDTEESLILQELAKLRREIEILRKELSDLHGKVTDIHRVAVRPAAPPAPKEVSLDEQRALGSAEAKVAIVEFSDYQCPYCVRFYRQTFPQLEENYIETGKVRFFFRDFPLTQIHPQAKPAAIAANCAGGQGAYWEMHDGLFENQGRLGSELYQELATELSLDVPAFQDCLAEPAESEKVDQELAYGQSLGVRGTPHYFVGRIEDGKLVDVLRVNGAQPFAAFSKVIDSLLQ